MTSTRRRPTPPWSRARGAAPAASPSGSGSARCAASATTWPSSIAAGRPYADMEDVARRNALTLAQLEALATAGACRRLWAGAIGATGGAARAAGRHLGGGGGGPGRRRTSWPGSSPATDGAHRCRAWTPGRTAVADLWATGVSPDGHPTRFVRDELDRLGVVPASDAGRPTRPQPGAGGRGGHPPPAAGHRRRAPRSSTSRTRPAWSTWSCRRAAGSTTAAWSGPRPALLIRGRLETAEGVINVIAETISLLPLPATPAVPRLPLTAGAAAASAASPTTRSTAGLTGLARRRSTGVERRGGGVVGGEPGDQPLLVVGQAERLVGEAAARRPPGGPAASGRVPSRPPGAPASARRTRARRASSVDQRREAGVVAPAQRARRGRRSPGQSAARPSRGRWCGPRGGGTRGGPGWRRRAGRAAPPAVRQACVRGHARRRADRPRTPAWDRGGRAAAAPWRATSVAERRRGRAASRWFGAASGRPGRSRWQALVLVELQGVGERRRAPTADGLVSRPCSRRTR